MVALIGAIDQGTSSTKVFIFEAGKCDFIVNHECEIKKIFPSEGWVEQSPSEIYESVTKCLDAVHKKLKKLKFSPRDVKCMGLTNQRESTIVWDSITGQPLYNCIVWLDNRTSDLVDQILDEIPGRDFNWLKNKTGLPISTYFSALKIKWLINNVSEVQRAIRDKRCMFGTVDCWLLWKLTGLHLTDVTNASRTLLMDIKTLEWDEYLCNFFGIPIDILPKIKSSSDYFGEIIGGPFKDIPITGVIGDQQSALVGQKCFSSGQAKVTLGTGCFLIQNIGSSDQTLESVSIESKRSLITTVAYKFGSNPACYALEGSCIAGAAISWLRDNLELINNYDEIEQIVKEDNSSAGLFFVPAFQGLYAPYWDAHASGTMIGITHFTRKCHLVRATLDCVAFQCNDILSLMHKKEKSVKVDGGMSSNRVLCQTLADISGFIILRRKMTEATALGAAMVAGYHYRLWNINFDHSIEENHEKFDIFRPNLDNKIRIERINTWEKAVTRSRKWIRVDEEKRLNYERLSALPFMFYVLLSFGSLILSHNTHIFY